MKELISHALKLGSLKWLMKAIEIILRAPWEIDWDDDLHRQVPAGEPERTLIQMAKDYLYSECDPETVFGRIALDALDGNNFDWDEWAKGVIAEAIDEIKLEGAAA